jgi:hypothetical protein
MGMAETDPASSDPWTGEDCLNGYVLGDGSILLYCHPLSSTGGYFASGGNPLELDEDSETVFFSSLEDSITYAAWSDSTGDCWTWGARPSYYTHEGCVEL